MSLLLHLMSRFLMPRYLMLFTTCVMKCLCDVDCDTA